MGFGDDDELLLLRLLLLLLLLRRAEDQFSVFGFEAVGVILCEEMQAPAAVNSHRMALCSKQVRCITMEVLCVCYIQPPRLLPLVLIQFRTGSAPALHMLRTRPNFQILTFSFAAFLGV